MKKAPFKLKSGNKTSFKAMGSSPYKNTDENGDEDKKKSFTEKAGGVLGKVKNTLVDMAQGGLSAVYGTGTGSSKPKKVKIAKEKEDEEVDNLTESEKIVQETINKESEDDEG